MRKLSSTTPRFPLSLRACPHDQSHSVILEHKPKMSSATDCANRDSEPPTSPFPDSELWKLNICVATYVGPRHTTLVAVQKKGDSMSLPPTQTSDPQTSKPPSDWIKTFNATNRVNIGTSHDSGRRNVMHVSRNNT